MFEKNCILIVDDSLAGRNLLNAILKREGYRIEFASSGTRIRITLFSANRSRGEGEQFLYLSGCSCQKSRWMEHSLPTPLRRPSLARRLCGKSR